MKIGDIYRTLCELYGISDALDIDHFLVMMRSNPADVEIHSRFSNREMLLVSQSGEFVEVGLYIAPAILTALELREPLDCIEEFSCATEGASHFLYVADRAPKGRCVSQLELELQAEVDKFLLIHLAAANRSGTCAPDLFERQFRRHGFDASLTRDELERYETASHFAAKFSSRLRERYFNPLSLSGLTAEARKFFEQDLAGKLAVVIP